MWRSTIYPGTERSYWIYVPPQYDPDTPTCLMVVQDGLSRAIGWNLPTVLDSLIALGEIPVTIGIFVNPGKLPAANENAQPRSNRSFEYDNLDDRYADFLVQEILPEVGRSYNISADPNDRAIAGASSGAICAFNAAWQRPDQFRRVLSAIGSYTGLRGGDTFATMVRKSEPKPIRVFLEDGDHDLNIFGGDWWLGNQRMLSALTWAGYEVNYQWGNGEHNNLHAKAIMPQALVWLWQGNPGVITAKKSKNQFMRLVLENEDWNAIDVNGLVINKLAIDDKGNLYFSSGQFVYKLEEKGKPLQFAKIEGLAGGLCFIQDHMLLVADLTQHKIVVVDKQGASSDLVRNVFPEFIAGTPKGIYFSETTDNRVGFYSFDKKKVFYQSVPGLATGISLSADQAFLNVGFSNHQIGYSFQIGEDCTLNFGQEFFHFHVPFGAMYPETQGITVDSQNMLYSATSTGIQVSDEQGRVNFILAKPEGTALDLKLGGANFDDLYLNSSGKLYRRKINAKGVVSQ